MIGAAIVIVILAFWGACFRFMGITHETFGDMF